VSTSPNDSHTRMTESPRDRELTDSTGPFASWVKVRNFKSIEKCRVELQQLTVLVGRNGAGKSNFLDALRFVADSLQSSLDHAIRDRGGIDAVRRQSTGHPRNFAIELEIRLSEERHARYGFELAPKSPGGFTVKREELRILSPGGRTLDGYLREDAEVRESSLEKAPPVAVERLYLINVAGFPEFAEVYEALSSMGFYNLNPDRMKELQSPDAGDLLERDGSNIPSVIARLNNDRPGAMDRITDFLQLIVPGIAGVERATLGPKETLQFHQAIAGLKHPRKFYATSMSDGTLRALGSLVAVNQLHDHNRLVNLVGIEEPETALHPAAAGALMDALREAADHTQIIVTTHSPDLADQVDPGKDRLLVVRALENVTQIAPADGPSLDAIREHLYSAGELLRMDQLEPDAEDLERQLHLELFEPAVEPV